MKIRVKFIFGRKSKAGYRHFNLLSLSVGRNGFGLAILGVLIIVKF